MIIKYFDEFEGQWLDITGTTGTTLQYNDASGWVGVDNKVIKGNISQVGTNTPTINIFENTTGATLTPYYSNVGEYVVQSNISLFTSNTMFITIGNNQVKDRPYTYIIKQSTAYELYFFSYNNGTAENDCLGNTSFEIKIY
jgi:hypothetical protein